jgi:hypothetical protein
MSREHEYTPVGECLLGLRRAGNIRTFCHDPRLEPRNIAGVDDIRPRRGYPDLARDLDHCICRQLAPRG